MTNQNHPAGYAVLFKENGKFYLWTKENIYEEAVNIANKLIKQGKKPMIVFGNKWQQYVEGVIK